MAKFSWISLLFLITVSSVSYAKIVGNLTEGDLIRLTQERMDAIDPANPRPYQEQYAKDALIFDEKGRSMDKATLVKEIVPLAKGEHGTLKVVHPNIRTARNTVVFSYDLNEIETNFGQVDTARYHQTDTWVNRDGKWQILATQVLRYYADPPLGHTDPSRYPEYVGTYELGPGVTLAISQEGSHLYYQVPGKKRHELLSETPDVFFSKGVEGRQLFKINGEGRVVAFIERRNNEDLVWRRLK